MFVVKDGSKYDAKHIVKTMKKYINDTVRIELATRPHLKNKQFVITQLEHAPVIGELEMGAEYLEKENKEKYDELRHKLHDESSGTGGGKGWYMHRSNADVYGKFLTGSLKGEPFNVSKFECFRFLGKDFKKGDKLKMTVERTYGHIQVLGKVE